MFTFFKKNNKMQTRIDTLIGEDTVIDGEVSFSGGLRVDGVIHGDVNNGDAKAGTLILSERGCIEGTVNVSHAVINGTIAGPLQVSEFVELQTKARVAGDVCYKTLEMHVGAVVEGKLIFLGESNLSQES